MDLPSTGLGSRPLLSVAAPHRPCHPPCSPLHFICSSRASNVIAPQMLLTVLVCKALLLFLVFASDDVTYQQLPAASRYSPDWNSLTSRSLPKVKRALHASACKHPAFHVCILTTVLVVHRCQIWNLHSLGSVFSACLGDSWQVRDSPPPHPKCPSA